MVRGGEDWLTVVDAFQSAALGEVSWESALKDFARATGSRSAQLTGVSGRNSVLFDVFPNVDPSLHDLYVYSLPFNPRPGVLSGAPPLKVFADGDFITADELRKDRFYQEIALPSEVPYICMTNLENDDGAFIALAAVRSREEGHITSEQRRVFAHLAPHARAAVRMELALGRRGPELLAGAMEALSIPAFVCDDQGKVRALTHAAESLVTRGRGLELANGTLRAMRPIDAKALREAIGAALAARATPGPAVLRTVIVRGEETGAPVILDIFALPSRCVTASARFTPCVLVVARGERGTRAQRAGVLQLAYGMTPAESEVALLLAEGKSVEVIANDRSVAPGTVRQQIKSILHKMGVERQLEIVARLARV